MFHVPCALMLTDLNYNVSSATHFSKFCVFSNLCRVLFLTGPAFFVTLSLATLEGLVAYAYFTTTGCDPLASKKIKNPNQVCVL